MRNPAAVSGEPGVARGWTELEKTRSAAGLRRGAVAVPRGGRRSWVNGDSEGEGFVGGEERETDCFGKRKLWVFVLLSIFRFFFLNTYIFNKNKFILYIFKNSTTRDYGFRIVFN